MMLKLFSATDVAAFAAGQVIKTTPIEARTPDADAKGQPRMSWATFVNMTNWICEVHDDQDSLRGILWPGQTPISLRVRTEKLYVMPVGQLTGAASRIPAGAAAIYVDVSDTEPPAPPAPFFTS